VNIGDRVVVLREAVRVAATRYYDKTSFNEVGRGIKKRGQGMWHQSHWPGLPVYIEMVPLKKQSFDLEPIFASSSHGDPVRVRRVELKEAGFVIGNKRLEEGVIEHLGWDEGNSWSFERGIPTIQVALVTPTTGGLARIVTALEADLEWIEGGN